MSGWIGDVDFPSMRPPQLKKGDRIHVPSIDRECVWVIDEVSEPDADGVIRADVHVETHETAPQPEG